MLLQILAHQFAPEHYIRSLLTIMAAQLYQLVHFSTAFIYLEATIAVYFWKHKACVFHVNNVLIEEFTGLLH